MHGQWSLSSSRSVSLRTSYKGRVHLVVKSQFGIHEWKVLLMTFPGGISHLHQKVRLITFLGLFFKALESFEAFSHHLMRIIAYVNTLNGFLFLC